MTTTLPRTILAESPHETEPTPLRVLTGTHPVRVFHPDGFFGMIQADGQQARIAALACEQDHPVVLSLVGAATSVSAVLATLWNNKTVSLQLREDLLWNGPSALRRLREAYRQFSAPLPGTRQVHAIALPITAHLTEGRLHPPAIPLPPTTPGVRKGPPARLAPTPEARFVLGNWDEPAPEEHSFLGHLTAMRVLVLRHAPPAHPEWISLWANALWERGLARELLVPLPALGVTAWRISDEVAAWNDLVADGVREGWLPWHEAFVESS